MVLTTYILSPIAPRGPHFRNDFLSMRTNPPAGFPALISNIPAGLKPSNKTSISSDTISEPQPISPRQIALEKIALHRLVNGRDSPISGPDHAHPPMSRDSSNK